MPLQGSVVVIAQAPVPELTEALAAAGAFPILETNIEGAQEAIAAAKPSLVLLADPTACADPDLAVMLERELIRIEPVVPIVAVAAPEAPITFRNALTLPAGLSAKAIDTRLSAIMRARATHAAVLRRAELARSDEQSLPPIPSGDPLQEATVIVTGRGRSYPALSVMLGEQVGLIGALSIETAAGYLKARAINGLVIGDGFSARHVDAFLIALSEDMRYRDLPVAVMTHKFADACQPNVIATDQLQELVERFIPFVRLHAFEERMRRTLQSFDNAGTIDPDTGLMFFEPFTRNLERAMSDAREHSTGLCIARFTFENGSNSRILSDAARLVSRLIRSVDFSCRDDDGSVLIVFTDTDLRHAHVVVRRIASVLKHTMLSVAQRQPIAPSVTLATLKPTDTVGSLLTRLVIPAVAAE